jgi:cell division protease FtsH
MAFHIVEDHPFLGREIMQEHREFSEHTARIIDEEVAKILHAAEDRAEMLLSENRDKLELVAEELLRNEVLDRDQIEELIGPSINAEEGRSTPPSRMPMPATVSARQRADD